jgi:ribose-phosphate pyrophosphokinase
MAPLLFSLDGHGRLVPALAEELNATVAPHEDRRFEDGEHKLRPLVDPRGADAYVVCSLYGAPQDSPHDKLCRLLFFAATLRDHGAARVTAVLPYLAYARKDRQTKPFDPVTLRYVAQMFESVGVGQVIVLEAHNVAALQNAFRCPTLHLEARHAFEPLLAELSGPFAVASPDPGGVKRALVWREALQERLAQPVGFAMVDKRRSAGVLSSLDLVAGAVEGQTVLLLDDLIASGQTMQRAAATLRREGAREVVALAAHGLFVEPAAEVLAAPEIVSVVVTDSVPPFRLAASGALANKLRVMSAAPLFAQAIRSCHAAWAH